MKSGGSQIDGATSFYFKSYPLNNLNCSSTNNWKQVVLWRCESIPNKEVGKSTYHSDNYSRDYTVAEPQIRLWIKFIMISEQFNMYNLNIEVKFYQFIGKTTSNSILFNYQVNPYEWSGYLQQVSLSTPTTL